jgi:hypothetical protein
MVGLGLFSLALGLLFLVTRFGHGQHKGPIPVEVLSVADLAFSLWIWVSIVSTLVRRHRDS